MTRRSLLGPRTIVPRHRRRARITRFGERPQIERAVDLSTTVVLTLAKRSRCEEDEAAAAGRSRGEVREARHGALVGRTACPPCVCYQFITATHGLFPNTCLRNRSLLRGEPEERADEGSGAEDAASRRGEEIESVSREEEQEVKTKRGGSRGGGRGGGSESPKI